MTTTRKSLKDTIISMGEDCKLSREEVFEKLKDFKNFPDYVDEFGYSCFYYAMIQRNVAAIEWFLDDTQRGPYQLTDFLYGIHLACIFEKNNNRLESKDLASSNKRKIVDMFMKKIWDPNRKVKLKDRLACFNDQNCVVQPSVYAMQSIINGLGQHVLPDKTDVIAPFLYHFINLAVQHQDNSLIEYILSVCREKDREFHWKEALIRLPQCKEQVNRTLEMGGRVTIAKVLIENDFPSNEGFNDSLMLGESWFPSLIILQLLAEKKITEQTALEILQLIAKKNKNLRITPRHLKRAIECQSEEITKFLLSGECDTRHFSMRDLAFAGWKSIGHLIDFHIEHKISLQKYQGENPSSESLVTYVLNEKPINKATLMKVMRAGVSFKISDIVRAMKTQDEELVQILIDEAGAAFQVEEWKYPTVVESWSLPSLIEKEMWKYPNFVKYLLSRGLPKDGKYNGDYLLTHCLRGYNEKRWSFQQVSELIDIVKPRNDRFEVLPKDCDLAIVSNDVRLLLALYHIRTNVIRSCGSGLIKAAELGNEKMVAFLLRNGAPALVDKSIFTSEQWPLALYQAIERGHFQVVKLLLFVSFTRVDFSYAIQLLEKENSIVPIDLRWRMKVYLTTANAIIKGIIKNKVDRAAIEKVHQDDVCELYRLFCHVKQINGRKIEPKDYFSDEVIKKMEGKLDFNRHLEEIYVTALTPLQTEHPKPSAPELKNDGKSFPPSASGEVKTVAPSAPPAEVKDEQSLPVVPHPLSPILNQEKSHDVKDQPVVQPEKREQIVLQDVIATAPVLPSEEGQPRLQENHMANAGSDDNPDEISKGSPPEEEVETQPGNPNNEATIIAIQVNKEHKFVTTGFTQFNCAQFQPVRRDSMDRSSDERCTWSLLDIAKRGDGYWEGNEFLQQMLKEFCKAKLPSSNTKKSLP